MSTVQQLAEEIVAREGGFVNDPADPGGATNHGVTIATLRRLGIDLTGDGLVTEADVRQPDRSAGDADLRRSLLHPPRPRRAARGDPGVGLRHVCECGRRTR